MKLIGKTVRTWKREMDQPPCKCQSIQSYQAQPSSGDNVNHVSWLKSSILPKLLMLKNWSPMNQRVVNY